MPIINLNPIVHVVPVLFTNWLTMPIDKPLGDGRVESVRYEVGVTVSNRYAVFRVDNGPTNRVLVSSQILTNAPLQVRPHPETLMTNYFIQYPPKTWIFTNGTLELR